MILPPTHPHSLVPQVVGDIVRLNAGDRVPSDGLVVDCSDLTCNESALTGESEDKVRVLCVCVCVVFVYC
jgi:P-type E1-E2 ATPase